MAGGREYLLVFQGTSCAKDDCLLELVQLSLSGLHVAHEIQEVAIVRVQHSELLIQCVLDRVDAIERAIAQDRDSVVHFATYSLKGVLLALVSSHQKDGTVVEAFQSAGHKGEDTRGDEEVIQDDQVVPLQGEVDICCLLWVHQDEESCVDHLGMLIRAKDGSVALCQEHHRGYQK